MIRAVAVAMMVLLAGCTAAPPTATPAANAQAANPASEFCVARGGKLEIRNGPGGQSGYCHLPDGSVVEEWEYFRTHHPKNAN